MLAGLLLLGKNLSPSVFNTLLMIVVGAIIYLIVLLIFKDSFLIDNGMNIINKMIKEK